MSLKLSALSPACIYAWTLGSVAQTDCGFKNSETIAMEKCICQEYDLDTIKFYCAKEEKANWSDAFDKAANATKAYCADAKIPLPTHQVQQLPQNLTNWLATAEKVPAPLVSIFGTAAAAIPASTGTATTTKKSAGEQIFPIGFAATAVVSLFF
ncbi:hypothetical protein HDU79_004167 [Rhizoclosmatium sp. JEL0117]|nr:hypothetical protein HDU79_004167 [Rhizoclosmatium sp. JEL0117]